MFQDNKDLNENLIDTQSLILFGLLHCKSTNDKKAKLYFEMTRKLMQLDVNQEIDKNDFKETDLFKKLCRLASFGLFEVT